MKSKKLLTILLIVQLVLCVALTAFAAEPELVFDITFDTMEPSGSIVNAGDTFTVAVNVTENPCFAALKGTFTFNPEYVTYVSASVENSAFTGIDPTISEKDVSSGKITFNTLGWNDFEAISRGELCYAQTGVLVEFTFTAKQTITVDTDAEFGFATVINNVIFVANYNPETGVGDGAIYADTVFSTDDKILIVGTEHEHTVVPATCEDNAYCSVCKEEFENTALGHNWSEYKTDADKHWKECTNGCGTIDAEAAHELSEASCTEPSMCAECGYIAVEAPGHDFSVWTQDEARQNHWKVCSVCGEVDETTRGAHEGGVANCTDDGVCTVCGLVYLDKLGHLYDENAEKGSNAEGHWFVCLREDCPEKNDTVKPHNPGAAVKENVVPASCTQKGSYDSVVYCVDCGWEMSRTSEAEEILAHTAGTPVEEKKVASTCTVAGSYEKVVYCSVCNTEMSRETVALELAEHTAGATVTENVIAATCYATGSHEDVVYCTVCNAEISRTVVVDEMIEHTPGESVIENTVAPNCTTDGSHDEVVYCSVEGCGAEISRVTKADAALGHDMTVAQSDDTHHWNKCSRCDAIDEKVAHFGGTATCTEKAVCEVCAVAYGTALGHDWADATCTAPKTCKRCDVTEGEKLAHEFGEWQSTKAPTTKEEGEETRTCNKCGETEKQTVAKLPVDYTWLIVAVILVLAAAGIVVVVVLKKKKK